MARLICCSSCPCSNRRLQIGQLALLRHQLSRHSQWKVCSQGVVRTASFYSNSSRQIEQLSPSSDRSVLEAGSALR